MALICQKQTEICEAIQKNLDTIRQLYDSMDLSDIDMNTFARETLQRFNIDYSFDCWELRSLSKVEQSYVIGDKDDGEWIEDPGVKVSYNITDDHPLAKNEANVSGINFIITRAVYSFVVTKPNITLIHTSNPNLTDTVYHINNKEVNISVETVNSRYDINLPLDISTWTNDDLLMLRMCI